MDFEVTVKLEGVEEETRIFLQAHEALAWVAEKFGQWNNFHPDKQMCVMFNKTKSEGETLGVIAGEDINLAEMLS